MASDATVARDSPYTRTVPTAQVYFFVAALFPGIVVLTKYYIPGKLGTALNKALTILITNREFAVMNFSAPSPSEPTIDIHILQISSA